MTKIGTSNRDQDSSIEIKDRGKFCITELTDCETTIYWRFRKDAGGIQKVNNVIRELTKLRAILKEET